MGIGARLREARVSKDLSLDTLQDITKIQKRYLVAIEEENFSVLPGKFYAKAFIKEYAIAVGLDPNQLMEEHVEEIPSPEEDTTQYTRIHRSRKDNMPTKSNAIFSFIPTLIVVILIIGIFFLAWWFITTKANDDDKSPIEETEDSAFYRDDNNKDTGNAEGDDENSDANEDDSNDENATNEEDQNTTGDNESDNQDENSEKETELGITVLKQGTLPKPESEVELTNIGEELILEFTATADVWLDVKNENGESLYGAMVNPNQPVELTLTGQERFLLNIGNAPGMTVKINDVEFDYPVDPTQRGADHQRIWMNVVESNE